MNGNTIVGIISLILGLIMIVCPLAGLITVNWVFALSLLFLAIFLLCTAFDDGTDIVNVIFAIILIILAFVVFARPAFLAFLTAFFCYLFGVMLIIVSIVNIFREGKRLSFILGIPFGLLAIVVGALFAHVPWILGIVFGIYFICAGIAEIVMPKGGF